MKSKKIVFDSRLRTEIVDSGDILYCCSSGYCTNVHLLDNQMICISKNLTKVHEWLPTTYFLRIHRGTLINITHVRYIHKGNDCYVLMDDNKQLPVAQRRRKTVLEKIKKYYCNCPD